MVLIRLRDVTLRHPGGFRLGPLSLELPPSRRTALVGPSGCGKTTVLRLIAGLQTADQGRIEFDGQLASNGRRCLLPPQSRRVGFVFEDGALWPHLDATRQLRFCDPGLSAAGAAAALARVGLQGKEQRLPRQLSGGEQQRLALARALVGQPDVLLLDEPLRAVDVHLRDELSVLIRALAEERRLTLVVVTHDREEALAIADHLVVLRDGRVVEAGAAEDLLRAPQTAFAAAFLAGATCLPARRNGQGTVQSVFGKLPAPSGEGAVELVLLPDDVEVRDGGPARGRIRRVLADGERFLLTVELEGRSLTVPTRQALRSGDQVELGLRTAPRLLPRGDAPAGGT